MCQEYGVFQLHLYWPELSRKKNSIYAKLRSHILMIISHIFWSHYLLSMRMEMDRLVTTFVPDVSNTITFMKYRHMDMMIGLLGRDWDIYRQIQCRKTCMNILPKAFSNYFRLKILRNAVGRDRKAWKHRRGNHKLSEASLWRQKNENGNKLCLL